MSKIAIVGFGHVGQGMSTIFPDAKIIDPDKGHGYDYRTARGFDLAIVCVPTPSRIDGSCDTSIVEEVVAGLESRFILIKSTVSPGTTMRLTEKHDKRIVFSPEYMGESAYWTPAEFPQPNNPLSHGFCILGAPGAWCSAVADMLLPRLGPATRFRFMTSNEAELVKYFENAFFSFKVAFANEMREVCERANMDVGSGAVNYHVVREGWLDDPRIGAMHTAAFKHSRGFDGKCLPKDIAALAAYCKEIGAKDAAALMQAVIEINYRRHEPATTVTEEVSNAAA